MRKVLVTGAAGFIGSHLVDALLERGDAVSALDNLSTGRRENLHGAMDRVRFIEAPLQDAGAVAEACREVEVVFHQAALPSVPRSVQDPRSSHDANIEGTFALLEAARAAGARRVVYAASSSAYGNQPGFPRVETMRPQPLSPYAVQKLTGELYLQSYAQVYGMETVALRYFNIFGPRQAADSPYSGVIAKFAGALLSGEPPVIFGDGEQGRDFTYVSNAVEANVLAGEAPAERVSGRVFNVATGERHTLNQTWETLARLAGSAMKATYGPARAGDVRDSLASIAEARERLRYEPRVGFEEGLRRTLEWYRAERR